MTTKISPYLTLFFYSYSYYASFSTTTTFSFLISTLLYDVCDDDGDGDGDDDDGFDLADMLLMTHSAAPLRSCSSRGQLLEYSLWSIFINNIINI